MQVENSKMIYRGSEELARVYRGDHVIVWEPYTHPYMDDYLTLEVVEPIGEEPMSFSFLTWSGWSIDVEFSKNNGEWIQYSSATADQKSVSVGDKVRVKGNNLSYTAFTPGVAHSSTIEISGATYNLSGNIMSLIYGDSFRGKRVLQEDVCLSRLFYQTNGYVLNAKDLCLPATVLSVACYLGLFTSQTRMLTPPELPARTLKRQCYSTMFYHCESMVYAPELPSTTLEHACYEYMFHSNYALTTAPVLPADGQIGYGFVYQQMFRYCHNLNRIVCMAEGFTAQYPTLSWVQDVSPTGTFVKNPNATFWTTGNEGIPPGWTVVDAS